MRPRARDIISRQTLNARMPGNASRPAPVSAAGREGHNKHRRADSCGQATALRFATPSACYVSRDRCGADGVVYSMLRGPYERRHRSLAERLLRVGLLGWLWFAACAIALAMAAVRFW